MSRVGAETFPELDSSIGVLVRNRLSLATARGRGDALRYELGRPAYAAGRS